MGLYDAVYRAFAGSDVPYVVVGGMAVVLSGHVRATVDLDVIVDLDPAPALRAVVSNPIDFAVLSAAAVPTQVGEQTVPVASLDHLIELKRIAGRPRDLDDIQALERLRDRSASRG